MTLAIYIIFSYLFMVGVKLNRTEDKIKFDNIIVIFAPITFPLYLGGISDEWR